MVRGEVKKYWFDGKEKGKNQTRRFCEAVIAIAQGKVVEQENGEAVDASRVVKAVGKHEEWAEKIRKAARAGGTWGRVKSRRLNYSKQNPENKRWLDEEGRRIFEEEVRG
jgi:hypothetical protein